MRALTDGHHHQVYRGQQGVVAFLETLLADHEHFQAVLTEMFEEHDGLTIGQVYTQLRQRPSDPVVQKYLSLSPSLPSAPE